MSSSTARLIDSEPSPNTDEQYGGQVTSGDTQTYRAISKHLKLHTFALSTITGGCLIATLILIRLSPSGSYGHWGTRYGVMELGKYILGSFIISFVNLVLPLHAIINLVLNIIFPVGIITKLVRFFGELPEDSWCARYQYPPVGGYPRRERLPDEPECLKKKKLVRILMIISGVFACLLAAVYILRAVLRGIVILKSKFWTKSSWSIPTGNYTFQISLNVIRNSSAETGSTPGHGPVHL